MSKLEGANKIADDVHFAVIGRAIADAARRGESFEGLANEALLLRQHEQDSADRQVQFARLARQIGDARRSGRDTAPLVAQLTDLRQRELGPAGHSVKN